EIKREPRTSVIDIDIEQSTSQVSRWPKDATKRTKTKTPPAQRINVTPYLSRYCLARRWRRARGALLVRPKRVKICLPSGLCQSDLGCLWRPPLVTKCVICNSRREHADQNAPRAATS